MAIRGEDSRCDTRPLSRQIMVDELPPLSLLPARQFNAAAAACDRFLSSCCGARRKRGGRVLVLAVLLGACFFQKMVSFQKANASMKQSTKEEIVMPTKVVFAFSIANNSLGAASSRIDEDGATITRRQHISLSSSSSKNHSTNRVQEVLTNESDQEKEKVTTTHHERPLMLQVPYYVYGSDSRLNWENVTFGKGLWFDHNWDYSSFKHSDDLWLYRASLRHPMHTKDPSEAKLFFVPLLLNAVAEIDLCVYLKTKPWKTCFMGEPWWSDNKDRIYRAYKFAGRHLGRSKYFRRSQGKDHVVVHSHYNPPNNHTRTFAPNLFKCNFINFESSAPIPTSNNVSTIPSWYVGKPCNSSRDDDHERIHDFAMIAAMIPERATHSSRSDICQWLQSGNYSVSRCGEGEQCPALAQAKYGFHARGDTWGSNRVMDLLLSRTIPLFTNPVQYDILPSFVPWKNLTYLVDVSSEEAFHKSLESILSRPPSDYHEKRRLIEAYIHIFDHRQIYQFDAYMAEFAKRLSLQ